MSLADDVEVMRQKMRDDLPGVAGLSNPVALKYGRGGIVDIEFVVQYLVLKYAAHYPDVGRWSDVVRIREALEAFEILGSGDVNTGREGYLGSAVSASSCGIERI
jgi:glutamate-ammonia-ligase adenylyltransferase